MTALCPCRTMALVVLCVSVAGARPAEPGAPPLPSSPPGLATNSGAQSPANPLSTAPPISVTHDGTNTSLVLVVGASGSAEYQEVFTRQAQAWQQAAAMAGYPLEQVGLEPGDTNDLQRVEQALAAEPKSGPGQLWIVLIGHGTFDGKEARFNLRGPDLSTKQLSTWLQPFQRRIAVVNTSPSSAPFLNALSATNRLIITATRSGHEQYHTRFGEYFAQALTSTSADLDKDDQVSLLEAFLVASRRAGEYYKLNGRIATEHALIDDNGDGLGTPADWFKGLRAAKKPSDKVAIDGLLAQQFHLLPSQADQDLTPQQQADRDTLVQRILEFRETKGSMAEEEYYRQLEALLLSLARVYYPATNGPSGAKSFQ